MSGNSSPTSIPGFSLPNFNNESAGVLGTITGAGIFAGPLSATAKQLAATPAPELKPPDALSSTPTLEQANTTRLQKQLASESAAAAYGTTLTSGAGLLDQPTTTSRVLLGN